MIVKQLTEHHLEFLSLTRGCTGSSESCQNAILFEITFHGSNIDNYSCNKQTFSFRAWTLTMILKTGKKEHCPYGLDYSRWLL